MAPVLALALLSLLCGQALGQTDTPVSKVVELLDGLVADVRAEGVAEATTYDNFACFCKDTTDGKSNDITSSQNTINTKSSTIAQKTATKEEKEDELKDRKKRHEEKSAELVQVEADYSKAQSEYNAKDADLSKAISSLVNAIASLEGSKPAAFLSVRERVQQGIALAGVLNLVAEPKRRAIEAFLQTHSTVDPNDPVFKFHSQGIIDVLDKLLIDFRKEKLDADTEFGKTTATFTSRQSTLTGEISTNSAAIGTLEAMTIPTLLGEIASARGDLVEQEATLKDEQAYLKDLTVSCEARANDWDQRSALRADEINKLEAALAVLRQSVVANDIDANKRVLIQRSGISSPPKTSGIAVHAVPSFLQEASIGSGAEAMTTQAKQAKASAYLRTESSRLHSVTLSSIAAHIDGDPFGKVKNLIQELIERLLRESTAEATKKGFCDEQLGKAHNDRDYRLEETQDLNIEIKGLELKEDELDSEIQMRTSALAKLRQQLQDATTDRNLDHEQNVETIKKAKEGLAGVQDAITILKVFYKKAGKATVLLQASPLDEDTAGAGFDGAYKGKQESSKAIIGMLEVIESDFDRTVRVTSAAEAEAHATFVKLERSLKSDISGNEEKKALCEEDLTTTRDKKSASMLDLQSAQSLLDAALRTLEDLKPVCIDTGMSYAERVSKREEEIDALHRALCILDTDNVESDCAPPGPPGGQGPSR